MSSKDKITKVTIARSSKLTLIEINALTERIISNANKEIQAHNAAIVSNPEYKRELKKIKTSTGVLAAEKALLFLKEKHKKVRIQVISDEFNSQQSKLYNSFIKRPLDTWENSFAFKRIKNELILSQVKNTTMDDLEKAITIKEIINS